MFRDPALPTPIHRLRSAWNAHDLAALAECLHPDYESVHPLHPERNLHGRAAVLQSWGAVFENIPDVRAELCRYAVAEGVVWTEWGWHGAHTAGPAYNAGGVMIFGLAGECILWARVYTETVCIESLNFDRILEDILNDEPEA